MKAFALFATLAVAGCGGEERVKWTCPEYYWCATESELSTVEDTSDCEVSSIRTGTDECECNVDAVGNPPCYIYHSWLCACYDTTGDYVSQDGVCSPYTNETIDELAIAQLGCKSNSLGQNNVCHNIGVAPWRC